MSTHVEVGPVTAAPEVGPVPAGFNWGAFMFPAIFLFANGRVGTAILLMIGGGVLGVITDGNDVILGIASLIVSLFCGSVANQLAWETGRYRTYDELNRSRRRWNIAALVTVGIVVLLILLAAIAD